VIRMAADIDFLRAGFEAFESGALEGLDLSGLSVDVACKANDRPIYGANLSRVELPVKGFTFLSRARPFDDIPAASKVAQRAEVEDPAGISKSIAR